MLPPPPAGTTRHTKLYHEDGNLVFRAGDTLYCVHASVLKSQSPLLKSLLCLMQPEDRAESVRAMQAYFSAACSAAAPGGVCDHRQGSCDWNPIVIPFPPEDIEELLLLVYLDNPDSAFLTSMDRQLRVLRAAHYLQMPQKFEFAHLQLSAWHYMPALLRLHYALAFDIQDWVRPALEDALSVKRAVDDFPHEHCILLGQWYPRVMKYKYMVDCARLRVALYAPPVVHSADCQHLNKCADAWAVHWYAGFIRWYLAPTQPLPPDEALDTLLKHSTAVPDMSDACVELTLDIIAENNLFGRAEQDVVENAIREFEAAIDRHSGGAVLM